jgi:hypothetical protein
LQDLQADAGGKGISISTLRSDADFIAVMRFPELVLRYDWPALARETGVYTNEKHLRDLVKRCFEKSLTEAALKERGLQQLLARLRATDGGTAPRALLPLATAPSTDLGVGGPLPFINGVVGARQVEFVTISAQRHRLGLQVRLLLPLPLRRYFRQQLTQGADFWKEERRIDVRSMLRREVMNTPRGPTLVGLHPSLRNEGPSENATSMLLREVMHTNRGPPPVGRAQAKGSVHSQTGKSRRILVAGAIRIRVS